jgi:hypothetical protein
MKGTPAEFISAGGLPTRIGPTADPSILLKSLDMGTTSGDIYSRPDGLFPLATDINIRFSNSKIAYTLISKRELISMQEPILAQPTSM